jgi:hypothetical protein
MAACMVVTVEAEDKHVFRDRLAEITASNLAVEGDRDPFYSEALFRKKAAGIPNARPILYQGIGYPASGGQFRRDLLAFLTEKKGCKCRLLPCAMWTLPVPSPRASKRWTPS